MSAVDELAKRLETDGFGTYGTTIKTMVLSDQPDDCIVVYPTGGLATEDVMGAGPGDFAFERSNFEVLVRNSRANSAYEIAYSIFLKLSGLHNVTLSGGNPSTSSNWQYVEAIEPMFIGPDESDRRYLVSVNLRTIKTKSV